MRKAEREEKETKRQEERTRDRPKKKKEREEKVLLNGCNLFCAFAGSSRAISRDPRFTCIRLFAFSFITVPMYSSSGCVEKILLSSRATSGSIKLFNNVKKRKRKKRRPRVIFAIASCSAVKTIRPFFEQSLGLLFFFEIDFSNRLTSRPGNKIVETTIGDEYYCL